MANTHVVIKNNRGAIMPLFRGDFASCFQVIQQKASEQQNPQFINLSIVSQEVFHELIIFNTAPNRDVEVS